jgi:hypothetical protein
VLKNSSRSPPALTTPMSIKHTAEYIDHKSFDVCNLVTVHRLVFREKGELIRFR